MTRVSFEGVQLDTRTRDMFVRLRWRVDLPLVLTQGSYSGGVDASAGTHDGGGALDIRTRGLTAAQKNQVVLIGRQLGFAIWLRREIPGTWPEHIHGIAIGCPDLSAVARDQVTDYWAGRNGLAGNGPDDGPDGYRSMTWEKYQAAHPDEEWEMTVGDTILAEVRELQAIVASFVATEAGRYTVDANRYADIKRVLADLMTEVADDEEEGVAGPRYAALQEASNRIEAAVQALPKS